MKSREELPDLMVELIDSVNTETGIPKFPKRATEIIREIAAWAKETKIYVEHKEKAESFWTAGATPSDIYYYMLGLVAEAPTAIHRDASVIMHMPALEKALDAQRRCRVCGCTDDNACMPHSCYWVEDDLCSECAGKERAAEGVGPYGETDCHTSDTVTGSQ
ncbi:MAG: hypothetical protein IJK63_09535 [Oscillospiraceae bacterium]|nr:hypothetical protein [Oscillospiraceae bacterium]